MRFLVSWWADLVYVLDFLTFSPWSDRALVQQTSLQTPLHEQASDYPIFEPPNGPQKGFFKCEYPHMKRYKDCSTHEDRGCWLKGPRKEYNIHTDYENDAPIGIKRKYYLEVSNMTLSPDGVVNTEGKVFNQSYPGPWIEACWGDELEITVKNNLPCNGTTIHWHGLRQLQSTEMDGVNGITQCPIAPGDTFTYRFRALQYGSSWYHSHYSLQVSLSVQPCCL